MIIALAGNQVDLHSQLDDICVIVDIRLSYLNVLFHLKCH